MNKLIESLKFTFIYEKVFPLFQIIKTAEWYLRHKNTYTPHLIKQKIIKGYKKKYDISIFIETGTYLGMMINAVKNTFSKIYTIELDKKLFLKSNRKYEKYPHIKILFGDSSRILPKLLKNIKKPCLFWLDAHYSKGITAKGIKNTPIMEELAVILKHNIKNHIILIDDAESFNGKNNYYPSVKLLKKYIENSFSDFFIEVKDNIIRIIPNNSAQKADRIRSWGDFSS